MKINLFIEEFSLFFATRAIVLASRHLNNSCNSSGKYLLLSGVCIHEKMEAKY